MDIVAPYGGVENMLRDIRKNEFPGKPVHLITPDPNTGGIAARELPPYTAASKEPANAKVL